MSIQNLKKGDIIDFDMIRPGIFGDQYKAALISGIVDYNTARMIDPEINAKHANFYPFFQNTVDNVNNPNVYDYLVLQLDVTKSNLVVIGYPWINPQSLKTVSSRYATVIIRNFQEHQRAPLVDFLKNLNVEYTLTVTNN